MARLDRILHFQGYVSPHIFLLGRCYRKVRYQPEDDGLKLVRGNAVPVGRMSHSERRHFLLQFHLVPSQDRRLLGYMFNARQRLFVMDGVKAYVNGRAKSVEVVGNLMKDEEEKKRLKEACASLGKKESRALLNKYMPHFRFAGKDISYLIFCFLAFSIFLPIRLFVYVPSSQQFITSRYSGSSSSVGCAACCYYFAHCLSLLLGDRCWFRD